MDGSFDDRIFREMRYERDRNDAPEGFPAMPEIPGGDTRARTSSTSRSSMSFASPG